MKCVQNEILHIESWVQKHQQPRKTASPPSCSSHCRFCVNPKAAASSSSMPTTPSEQGKLRWKRIKLNRIKDVTNRRNYARQVIKKLTEQLNQGWNPWIAKDTSDLMFFWGSHLTIWEPHRENVSQRIFPKKYSDKTQKCVFRLADCNTFNQICLRAMRKSGMARKYLFIISNKSYISNYFSRWQKLNLCC